MADTHGFEVIAEIAQSTLKTILRAAWKSGGDLSDEGVIPEYIDIPGPAAPAPVRLGPYEIQEGFVQIPIEQLDLVMDVPVNGVKVTAGTTIHLQILNPPIDAAKFFDLDVTFDVRLPIRELDAATHVLGMDFLQIPANGITATITNGNPLDPIIAHGVEQYVHQLYRENRIPHVIDNQPINFLGFRMKVRADLYDDLSVAAKTISVQQSDATHVVIGIPCHLRFYDITGSYGQFSLATPMGVDAIVEITAEYSRTDSLLYVLLTTSTLVLRNITPATGNEGTNYTYNKNAVASAGVNLEALLQTSVTAFATVAIRSTGDIAIPIPTLNEIESFMTNTIRNELTRRKSLELWRAEDSSGTTPVQNVQSKALANALAICLNAGAGANAGAVTYFVPANRDFAIAIAKQKVLNEFEKQELEKYGQNIPPSKTLDEKVRGKTVKLNELNLELHQGHISVTGNVTVVDAIAGSIDVDADFEQKVKLHWEDVAGRGQTIKHDLDGDPHVGLGFAAWLLVILIGAITFGVVGIIIGVVIMAVIEGVASSIGGSVARDESGQVAGIGAWPENLNNIGSIQARFDNPVIIEESGLVFAGSMIITSQAALTSIDMARSHGPYKVTGNEPVNFNGGADQLSSVARWKTGEGATLNARSVPYRYGKSGLYIANLQVKVDENGGATTRHYSKVEVVNVIPQVRFDQPVLSIREGEVAELCFTFTDDNWLDTHIAWIDYGDNTIPEQIDSLEVSHEEPVALGKGVIQHAWCDNGEYTVTVFVQDDAGGLGTASCIVSVSNVPPKITLPAQLFVIKDQPVRLEAYFTDPGWCDTHVAKWHCGDGSVKMSTIKETHTQPEGRGIASIVHVYKCIGDLVVHVSVRDDDGAETKASMTVSVMTLKNAHFEKGFRLEGIEKHSVKAGWNVIANEWYPFSEAFTSIDPNSKQEPFKAAHFVGEEFITRDGQRAQGIKTSGSGVSGILQMFSVNPHWEYEFTAHYHLPEIGTGRFVIGLDPQGRNDVSSPDIKWVFSAAKDEWIHASVRVRASGHKMTCMAGIMQEKGDSVLYLDKLMLYMIQPNATLRRSRVDEPNKEKEVCKDNSSNQGGVDLADYDLSHLDQYFTGYHRGTSSVPSLNPTRYFAFDKTNGQQMINLLSKGIRQAAIKKGVDWIKKMIPFGERK